MDALVVTFKADMAHFRKPQTTASPLTYMAPPRTAISGMLGAIAGAGRSGAGSYHRRFAPERLHMGIVIDQELSTQFINRNRLKIKGETKKVSKLGDAPTELVRKQIPHECIMNPEYTLYLAGDTPELFERLRENKSVYTPYLGTGEHLASWAVQGTRNLKTSNDASVSSIINSSEYNPVIKRGVKHRRETVPFQMDENRTVTDFVDVVFATNPAETVQVNNGPIFHDPVAEQNIVFYYPPDR